MTIRNLEYLFKPRSIAVIGRGKAAGGPDATVEFNLIEGGFKGPVMPVNPDHRSISGRTGLQGHRQPAGHAGPGDFDHAAGRSANPDRRVGQRVEPGRRCCSVGKSCKTIAASSRHC